MAEYSEDNALKANVFKIFSHIHRIAHVVQYNHGGGLSLHIPL